MIVIFYFMLLCISSCLQRTCIACKIRKKTINVIKNEGKCIRKAVVIKQVENKECEERVGLEMARQL